MYDLERRGDAAEAAAKAAAEAAAEVAEAASDEDEEGREDSDKSASGTEEVEEDKGVAHDAQLTNRDQVVQLIKGIKDCQNTAVSQKFAG